MAKPKHKVGKIGVQRTLPISANEAWTLLTTQPGLGYWLGHGVETPFKKGQTFKTSEGTTGDIRSYSEGSLIRLRWQPSKWDFASTLQIRVKQSKKGATISFHHEKLENGEQRERMQKHWMDVMEKLEKLID